MKLARKLFTLLFVFVFASCNISSTTTSSSSNSITTNQPTNVSSIEISTTSSLTQFLGLTSRVVVNAKLNSATPTSIDWFVDDQLSVSQKGLIFEYFPTAVKTYQIVAKVGTVTSNIITLTVGLPKFSLSAVEAVTSTQLTIKGDPGLSFSINGVSISNTSNFNIANQIYTLNLLTPLTQGQTYNIQASKGGFDSTIFPFIFETRKLSVANITYKGQRVVPNKDGAYEIQKPFVGATSEQYLISLLQTNLEGTNVPVSIITNVPSGATVISPFQTTLNIQKGINITKDYTLTAITEPGLYVHNISVSNVNLVLRVVVSNPIPKLDMTTLFVYDTAKTSVGGSALDAPFATNAEGDYIKKTIKPDANGRYVIFRPYNGSAFEFTFVLTADNFITPLGFPAAPANPYNIIAGLSGPSGGIMYYGNTVNTLASIYPFRESTGNNYRISQYVDNKTTLGTYTYTFTATGYSLNITRNIVVEVRAYAPTLETIIEYNEEEIIPNSDGSYTIYKPIGNNVLDALIKAKISNYESPLASNSTGGPGLTTLYNDGTSLRYLLDTRITYSGPLVNIVPLVTKIGIELGGSLTLDEKNVTAQVAAQTVYQSYTNSGAFRTIDLSAIKDEDEYTTEDDNSIFDALRTVTSTTFPGVHTFNIQIGGLNRVLVFRVLEPTPLLLIKEDVVLYGPIADSASEDNVKLDKSDGRYYVDGKNGHLKINVYPFGMPSGEYPYTFTRLTPSGSFQSNTNLVNLTLRVDTADTEDIDGDGNTTELIERYDGTLKFPVSGSGSEMVISEMLTEEGEYVFSFTINGKTQLIRVVVLPEPQLRIETISLNDKLINPINNTYYINHSASVRFLDLVLDPLNIDPTYKYIVNSTGSFPIGSGLTSALQDLVIVDGKMIINLTVPTTTTPTAAETYTFLIALYKGSVRVGAVTKVFVISEPVRTTIFFDSDGGTVIASRTGFAAAGHGAVPTSSNISRTGFTFEGWFTEDRKSVV
jgi:hypothetical protein